MWSFGNLFILLFSGFMLAYIHLNPWRMTMYSNSVNYRNTSSSMVLRSTYALLAVSLLPTILGAWLGMQIPFELYMAHRLAWFIGSLVTMFGVLFLTHLNKNNPAGVFFCLLFTAIAGFLLGPTLQFTLQLHNGVMILSEAIGLTAFALFATSLYVTISKRDFSAMGGFLFASLWIIIGAGILNMFFHSALLYTIISAFAVIIFVGYLMFDISKVVNGGETNYVIATLEIYLDLLNLFLNLLQLLIALQGGDRD